MQAGPLADQGEALPPRPPGQDLAVGQAGGLGDQIDDVHAEAVDAPVQPPVHHRVHGGAHLGVLPVEVGLFAVEEVQVVLAGRLVQGPRGSREEGPPVVRLRAGLSGSAPGPGRPPVVPVALRVVLRGARGGEPRVLVRGVVHHQVHHEFHAPYVRVAQQRVELLHRPEQGVDAAVVGDVVAVVRLRTAVDGRQPQDVDPQRLQVVEAAPDAPQVADPVAVGVLEGARVDLVDDGALPPVVVAQARFAGGDELFGEQHGAPAWSGIRLGGGLRPATRWHRRARPPPRPRPRPGGRAGRPRGTSPWRRAPRPVRR